MSKPYLIGAAVVVLGIVLWFLFGTSLQKPSSPQALPVSSSLLKTQSLPLFSQTDPTRRAGTATIEGLGENSAQIQIAIKLDQFEQGIVQPAHIHAGSCDSLGEIQYPLNAAENGFSQTVLNLSLEELRSNLPLAINIHKSREEQNIYSACTDIQEKAF